MLQTPLTAAPRAPSRLVHFWRSDRARMIVRGQHHARPAVSDGTFGLADACTCCAGKRKRCSRLEAVVIAQVVSRVS
jgi:hypothetical protein